MLFALSGRLGLDGAFPGGARRGGQGYVAGGPAAGAHRPAGWRSQPRKLAGVAGGAGRRAHRTLRLHQRRPHADGVSGAGGRSGAASIYR